MFLLIRVTKLVQGEWNSKFIWEFLSRSLISVCAKRKLKLCNWRMSERKLCLHMLYRAKRKKAKLRRMEKYFVFSNQQCILEWKFRPIFGSINAIPRFIGFLHLLYQFIYHVLNIWASRPCWVNMWDMVTVIRFYENLTVKILDVALWTFIVSGQFHKASGNVCYHLRLFVHAETCWIDNRLRQWTRG